jgi:hypothetical protein
MNLILNDRLRQFLINLECLHCAGQHDAVVAEVMETNGSFDAPSGRRSHLWDLHLHGISSTGASAEEAIANWKRLAHATAPLVPATDDERGLR